MSSHREAPEISKDPVADNTDVYAFVSRDEPDKVTIIANFIPFQSPQGGPNFYEFGDDVTYAIHVSNRGKGEGDITYRFHFHTEIRNPDTFLYNTGPIHSIKDTTWNRPQFYRVTRTEGDGKPVVLAKGLRVPPVNVGPRSTPNYAHFTAEAVHDIGHGRKVFAGQRAEGFYVDLGSIFDLGALRPFQHLHLIPSADAMGVNGGQGVNVHSIALAGAEDRPHGRSPQPDQRDGREVRHRSVGDVVPAEVERLQSEDGDLRRHRAVGAGVAVGQSAVQRGHRADGRQGPLEPHPPARRQAVRPLRRASGTRRAAARALPGRVPEPGEVQEAAGRSGGDPAHRHPCRHRPRFPEHDRAGARRHAAAQHGDQAGGQAEQVRPAGRRRVGVPQRTAGGRRHRCHRTARHRGSNDPARRQLATHPTARRVRSPTARTTPTRRT